MLEIVGVFNQKMSLITIEMKDGCLMENDYEVFNILSKPK